MATGACGINCEKCKLYRRGVCSSCGGGTSEQGMQKIATQKKLLGMPCSILACANMNHIGHCLSECDSFPCENFRNGPYPFSRGFLDMQKRRRKEQKEKDRQKGSQLPEIHWERLKELDPEYICRSAGAQYNKEDGFRLSLLEADLLISTIDDKVLCLQEGKWVGAEYLQSLIALTYLTYAKNTALTGDWVTEKDLKCASFFRGIHELPKGDIMERFGNDPKGFAQAGEQLGAIEVDGADAALRVVALPKVQVKILLWAGDDDLPPGITFLFDRSIDNYLPADGIWALVKHISQKIAGAD